MSPLQLENSIQDFEAKWVSRWSLKGHLLWLGIGLGCLFLFLSFPLWSSQMPGWSRFFIIQDRYWGGLILFAGFVLSLPIPEKFKSVYIPILVAASWLIPCFILHIYRMTAAVPLLFLTLQTYLLSRPRTTKRARAATGFAVAISFATMIWLIGADAEASKDYLLFRLFWTMHLEMLAIYFFAMSFRSAPIPIAVSLNPLQLFFPLPWPDSVVLAKSAQRLKELRFSGCIRLFISEILIVGLLWLLPHLPEGKGFAINLIHYFIFLVFAFAGLGTVTGFLRAFGYEAKDATYFLFLAKSPLEIWQRGSTYMAEFIFQNIFFPTWKRSRSLVLAAASVIIAVFFHLYFFHEYFLREFLRWLAPSLPIPSSSTEQVFVLPAIWIFCWLCWIGLFALLTKSSKFFKTDLGSWLGVVITHLGSAQIMGLTHWVLSLIGQSHL